LFIFYLHPLLAIATTPEFPRTSRGTSSAMGEKKADASSSAAASATYPKPSGVAPKSSTVANAAAANAL
jgi:hypothetical protein